MPGIINLPAVLIVCAISVLLMIGISESAKVNAVIVVVKVTIVIVVIAVGYCLHQAGELHPLHSAEYRHLRRVRL